MSLLFCLCVCVRYLGSHVLVVLFVCVQYLGSHVLVVLFVCVCSVLRVTCPCCFVVCVFST